MKIIEKEKLVLYYVMVVLSVLISVASFSYSAWRMEASEANNNRRMAAFELIKTLGELEQNIFAAHYDQDPIQGSPRLGWVKIGLARELSYLCGDQIQKEAMNLQSLWSASWAEVPREEQVVQKISGQIDLLRAKIRDELTALK